MCGAKRKLLEDSSLANSPTIFTNANTLLGRGITFLSISIASYGE